MGLVIDEPEMNTVVSLHFKPPFFKGEDMVYADLQAYKLGKPQMGSKHYYYCKLLICILIMLGHGELVCSFTEF